MKLKGYNPEAISSGVKYGVNFSQHSEHVPHGTSSIGSSEPTEVKLMFMIL